METGRFTSTANLTSTSPQPGRPPQAVCKSWKLLVESSQVNCSASKPARVSHPPLAETLVLFVVSTRLLLQQLGTREMSWRAPQTIILPGEPSSGP